MPSGIVIRHLMASLTQSYFDETPENRRLGEMGHQQDYPRAQIHNIQFKHASVPQKTTEVVNYIQNEANNLVFNLVRQSCDSVTNSIQIFQDPVVLRSKACAFGVHDRKRVCFQCMCFECTASKTACVLSGTHSKCKSIDVLEPQCVSPQILDKCGYIRVAFKEYAGDHTCYQLPQLLATKIGRAHV